MVRLLCELWVKSLRQSIIQLWLRSTNQPSKRNIFSSLRRDEHGMLRKRVSAVYAKTFLQSCRHIHAITSELVQTRFLPMLWTSATCRRPVDMLSVNYAYGLDFVTAFIFGLSRGTNFIQQEDQRRKWLEDYDRSHPHDSMFWLQEQPNLTRWLRNIGIHVVPEGYVDADVEFENWGLQMIDATDAALQAGLSEDCAADGDMPLMYHQLISTTARQSGLKDSLPSHLSPEQRREIASECLDHIGKTINQHFPLSQANSRSRHARYIRYSRVPDIYPLAITEKLFQA